MARAAWGYSFWTYREQVVAEAPPSVSPTTPVVAVGGGAAPPSGKAVSEKRAASERTGGFLSKKSKVCGMQSSKQMIYGLVKCLPNFKVC